MKKKLNTLEGDVVWLKKDRDHEDMIKRQLNLIIRGVPEKSDERC